MSDQPRQRSPWRLNLIVFLGVVGIYFFLARPAEPVNDLSVSEDFAYLALGRAGIVIVDISDSLNPEEIGSFDTLGLAKAVAVQGEFAYVADGREGLRILDVSNPNSPTEVGAATFQDSGEDVAVAGQNAYVAAGRSGLKVFNIKDKSSPAFRSSFAINAGIYRAVIQENYIYLGDDQNNFRVVSISNPNKLEEISVLEVGSEIQGMDILEDRAYLAIGDGGMLIVDISNPTQPVIIQTIETGGFVQDVAVDGGIIAFLADENNGLLVFDISDLNAVEGIGSYSDLLNANQVELAAGELFVTDKDSALFVVNPEVSPTSQSISNTETQQGSANSVVANDDFVFVAYTLQGLRVIDVRIPDLPVEVASYISPGEALGVTLSGDFIYLADGSQGMRVLFLEMAGGSNFQVSEISVVETPGEVNNIAVEGQTAYLADGSNGLRVVSMVNPAQPVELGSEETPGIAMDVAVWGEYAYVADGDSGLRIINILDGSKPAEVGAINIPGEASSVFVTQTPDSSGATFAYVAAGEAGLRVINVTDPLSPFEVGLFTSYGAVLDVMVSGEIAYLVTGNMGLRIVNISDPMNIREIGAYDSPGESLGLYLRDSSSYIADGTRGLRIVDVSNPTLPIEVGFYDIPRVVQGVTVDGDFAYLTDLQSGFRITDVSDPRHLKQVGHYDQGGIVADIAIQGNIAFLADAVGLQTVSVENVKNPIGLDSATTPSRATSVFVEKNLAFVTDRDFGLSIMNVSDPAAVELITIYGTPGFAKDVFVAGNYAYIADGEKGLQIINVANPSDPKTASVLDQFQDAVSVIVVGDFAYLADGPNGVWVIDVEKPVTPQTIAFIDTPGTPHDLENSGTYLFIADGGAGVQVLYIINPESPTIVAGIELEGTSLDLDVEWRFGSETSPGSFLIYVAKADRGLEIVSLGKGVTAFASGLYETPGMAPLRQVIRDGIPFFSSPGNVKSSRTVRQTFFDFFVIGILGLLLWMAFFAQYLLPLKNLRDRREVFNRLLSYLLRSHGPAIRIENGRVIQGQGDLNKKGPGVILLDTASAAVLRTKTAFKRAVGPGVVFTEDGEFLHHDAIDLHTQVRPLPPLGPFPGEDPFAPRLKRREDEQEFIARQSRRKETSALTRDGIEVVANILAISKLRSLPGQGGTRFGFNSHSVQYATTREGVVPNGLRNVPWHEIPAYLAVDVWREYLGKFTLVELFNTQLDDNLRGASSPSELIGQAIRIPNGGETRFEKILRMVHLRMTHPEVPRLDEYGRETNELQVSREFRILEEMGILVKDISIGGVRFPRAVESQLVQQWLSTWLERAKAERNAIERRRILAGEIGKEAALLAFTNSSIRILAEAIVDDDGNPLPPDSKIKPDLRTSLDMLVAGTQQLFARNPMLHQLSFDEESVLIRLLEWVRR